jgi:putative tricarboxylic transport membrane protein
MDRRIDLAIALLVVVLGLAVIIGAQDIRRTGPVVDPIGPRAMPYIVGMLFILGGLRVVSIRLGSWRRDSGHLVATDGEPDEPGVPASARQAFTVIAASVVYALSLSSVGYIVATPLYVVVGLKAMRVKSWWSTCAAALVYTTLTYVLFAHYMRVDLPLGILTGPMRSLGLAHF